MLVLKTKNWQLDNIETVIFDKDGTFIDLHYFWGKMTELRVKEIIRRYGLDEKILSDLCLKLGYDIAAGKMLSDGITAMYSRAVIIEIFCKDLNELGLNINQKDLEKIFDEVNKIFYCEMVNYTKPIAAAILFIEKLRKLGAKIGIVTSDSKESTILTLKHFEWEELFDVVIGRESTVETKESGVPVKLALEKLGADAKTAIMVGDTPMDYQAAKNGGIENTILVATGQVDKEALLMFSPYSVVSLADVEIICI